MVCWVPATFAFSTEPTHCETTVWPSPCVALYLVYFLSGVTFLMLKFASAQSVNLHLKSNGEEQWLTDDRTNTTLTIWTWMGIDLELSTARSSRYRDFVWNMVPSVTRTVFIPAHFSGKELPYHQAFGEGGVEAHLILALQPEVNT